jgi:hypothetical protein
MACSCCSGRATWGFFRSSFCCCRRPCCLSPTRFLPPIWESALHHSGAAVRLPGGRRGTGAAVEQRIHREARGGGCDVRVAAGGRGGNLSGPSLLLQRICLRGRARTDRPGRRQPVWHVVARRQQCRLGPGTQAAESLACGPWQRADRASRLLREFCARGLWISHGETEPATTRGTAVTGPLCSQCAHGRLRQRLDREVPRGLRLDAYDAAHGDRGTRALYLRQIYDIK